MKFALTTFANIEFQDRQFELLNYSSDLNLFDNISFYTDSWLKTTEFYKKNNNILDLPRGCGYWLWKPFIILETFKKINDGDSVMYIDCGDFYNKKILDYIKPILEKETCLLLGGGYINKDWTKRDCFYYMNCDNQEYHNVIQLEAGVQFWKKTDQSIKVLEEQLYYGGDYRIITDSSNESGYDNFPTFKDHRHDQSILTNLFVKYKLAVDSTKHETQYNQMRKYINCNVR